MIPSERIAMRLSAPPPKHVEDAENAALGLLDEAG
jgi:hypothetical protein